jgi:PAS domain S-box-containing protein
MKEKKFKQHLYDILDSSCIIAITVDEKLKITYANKGAELVSGYKKEEMVGKNAIETFIPKKFKKNVLKVVLGALAGKEQKLVAPIITKSGEKRLLCWKGKIRKDKNGKRVLAAFAHDITDEIETRKTAERNEKLYKQLVENSFALIYTKDLNGRYLSVNPTWNMFEGFDREKTIGKTDYELFDKEAAKRFRHTDNITIKTKKMQNFQDEFIVNGKTHYQNTVKYPLRDEKGKVIGVCGISHDITEKIKAEKEIRVFERIFEQTSEGMAVATLDGKIINANRAWVRMHGFKSNNDIIGKHLKIFHTKQQLVDDVMPFNKKTMKIGHYAGPVGHVTKDGKEFQTFMTTSILKNERGEPYAMIGMARDITKEKDMEEKLKESEIRYRNMFKNIQTAVAVYKAVDKGNNFVFVDFNPAAEKIEKIKKKDIVGKKVTKAFPGVKKFGLLEVFKRVWKTGRSEEFPTALYKDRRIVGWRENFVYKLPSGEIVAAYTDQTKRKIAEDKLKESEARYRALIETAPNGVLLCDKNENLLFANKQFAKMLGFKVNEIVGKNLRELTDEKNFIKFKKGTLLRIKGLSSQYECEFFDKKGNMIPILMSAAPLLNKGEYESSMSVATDISDLKVVEKALRESEKKYRSLFTNIRVGVYRATFGNDGKFLDANPALCRILGYKDVEELKKIKVRDIYQKPYQRSYFSRKIEELGSLATDEIKMKKKDGTPIIVSDTAGVIYDNNGKPLYFDGILEDITEKKKLEEKIKIYAEHLEKMVLQRTRELEEKTREALRANRVKSNFLATVSHELRTPLTSIIGYTELLEDDVHAKLNEVQLNNLSVIKKNANQLLQLISDILDITKIEKRKMQVAKESFIIREVLDEIQNTFKPLFSKKGVSLKINIDKNVPETMISDRMRIKRVLFNLTSNALKFTPRGEVNIHVYKKGKKIMFEVKDTGIGIEKSEKEKIFEVFQRTDHPLVRRAEGSGLGLVITKKMVNLLKGTIEVESKEGEGSLFTTSFPIE